MTADQQGSFMFGKYTLKRPLGKGGLAQVYLATMRNESRRPAACVIKFPLPQYASRSKYADRFIQEAELLIELGSHDNIVYVFDVGRYRGMPYLAMEYIDGIDLAALLKALRRKGARLSTQAIYCILGGMVAGLHHAHSRATIDGVPLRIVHRDVTPSNVIISRDGAVKLVDFGLGVAVEQGTSGEHWRGTLAYMSPEHLYCQVCPAMDMYSLGIIGWEMLTNRPLRSELIEDPGQLLAAFFDDPIPSLTADEAEPQLAELIMSCFSHNTQQRPRADEFAALLAKCPGYTRDPRVLEQEISPVVGEHRSSGHSKKQFAASAELVATMAVVEHGEPDKRSAEPFEPKATPESDAPRFLRRHKSSGDGARPHRAALADDPPSSWSSRERSQMKTREWQRPPSDPSMTHLLPQTGEGCSEIDVTPAE